MPMTSNKLNICLHNIVDEISNLKSVYDITISQLEILINTLKKLINNEVINDYELFFDDGYESFYEIAENFDFGISNGKVHTAIITELIGVEGRLSESAILALFKSGFSIDSHGVSHAALAVFKNEALRATPHKGEYRNSPYGKTRLLSENEALYQLIESSAHLEAITGLPARLFVLPYGLYNYSTVLNVAAFTHYSKVYSCDTYFDKGKYLAPRIVITQDNVNIIETTIRNIPSSPVLLVGDLNY